jgi:hypothetical protein
VGWAVAAELPEPSSDASITVALIAALGTVVVALIGLAAQWLSRSARTTESPPAADAKLSERVAVVDARSRDDRRTLVQLDRHVDGIGDEVDRLRWDVDDLKAWREEHRRRHGQQS